MKKKNILIVTPIFPPDIGGPASYSNEVAQRLSMNSCDVRVIAFGEKKQVSSSKYKGVSISRINVNSSFIFRQYKLFKEIFSQLNKISVVYAQGTLTVGFAVMLACKLKSKSYFVKYVGDEVWEGYQAGGGKLGLEEFLTKVKSKKSKVKSFVRYSLNWLVLKNAKKVVCPGRYLKDILMKYYSVNAVNIPNAIEIRTQNLEPRTVKKKGSIVCIGRLVTWKNVGQVIEAFKRLQTTRDKLNANLLSSRTGAKQHDTGSLGWGLTIIGDGVEINRLKRKVKSFRLEHYVNFAGKLSKEETLKYLYKSDFCVLYSSYEGLSHTLLEAMATKTKIVASDIVANRDVLENGKLGKLVELNNVDKLLSAFEEDYNIEMLDRAYEAVNKKYTWKNHIDMLLNIFSKK